MNYTGAIFYGVIQGIAEFLPVSSSGHLALAQNFHLLSGAEAENDMAFNVLLHLGTLLSVVIVLRRDVFAMINGAISLIFRPFRAVKTRLSDDERLFLSVFTASLMLLPAAFLEGTVANVSKSSAAIGVLLILNGVMLMISGRLSGGKTMLENVGTGKAMLVGAFQAFGVLPGISRSGATVTGGLLCGMSGKDAVRFSFLLSVPAITGACVMELGELGAGISEGMTGVYAAGALTSFAVGVSAIKLLEYLARKKNFLPFALYCVIAGSAAIIFSAVFDIT